MTLFGLQVGVQTDSTQALGAVPNRPPLMATSSDPALDVHFNSLSPSDLISIIKSSQVCTRTQLVRQSASSALTVSPSPTQTISSEINISAMLESFTEIISDVSASVSSITALASIEL